jgi:hypothetical protein
MIPHADLQRRLLDDVTDFAPTFEDVQMNERATAAWEARARLDPTGLEASGLEDILALQRMFKQLYKKNTLGRSDVAIRS